MLVSKFAVELKIQWIVPEYYRSKVIYITETFDFRLDPHPIYFSLKCPLVLKFV